MSHVKKFQHIKSLPLCLEGFGETIELGTVSWKSRDDGG